MSDTLEARLRELFRVRTAHLPERGPGLGPTDSRASRRDVGARVLGQERSADPFGRAVRPSSRERGNGSRPRTWPRLLVVTAVVTVFVVGIWLVVNHDEHREVTVLATTPLATETTNDTRPTAATPPSFAPMQVSSELDRLPDGAPGCAPPSPQHDNEIRGTTSGGVTLYGLVFGSFAAGLEVEVAWRMSGFEKYSGNSLIAVYDPEGNSAPQVLTRDPESRTSNYSRAGSEIAYWYKFDRAGCWHLLFQREGGKADVWIRIP